MSSVNSKTTARLAAIQAMYQFESNGQSQKADEICDKLIKSYHDVYFKDIFDIDKEVNIELHKNYFKTLVELSIDNVQKLDDIITSKLTGNWKYSNLHMSLAALLRVAIAEILFCPEVPYKVIVNEFTNIGSSLAKESEISFINSLLDKVSKEYRNDKE